MTDLVKFETGNLAMISGGKNTGRVGVIVSREKHQAMTPPSPRERGLPLPLRARTAHLKQGFVVDESCMGWHVISLARSLARRARSTSST